MADEVDDAHKLAVTGRDAYWNCLAREYPRDSNKAMSDQEFTSLIANRLSLRAAEFPGVADRLPVAAISEAGCRRPIFPPPTARSSSRRRTS